ncbi:Alpha/Beta hydrolase protein [Mycena alexandri]|uniref:Alpha/Beta hydrolase protein n=1 Tax=Mycena alexandri TaxID=1745969 RepID=A0AAD6WME6_9AGAR|nr:Alpha/Beta hydrolase protein [Mycena alexandri]
MRAPKLKSPLLPQRQTSESFSDRRRLRGLTTRVRWLMGFTIGLAWVFYSWRNWNSVQSNLDSFYSSVASPKSICAAVHGDAISHAGHIGLKGDSEAEPKLTIGGGPGTSGMSNPLSAQGPCLVTENGTVPNPNRWTENFNLISLDHPVGVGYSYGTLVNNSRTAAVDVYDFLQKFFRLFPHLSQNQFILSGGSYGGMYIPHIATVIHEQNLAIAKGKGLPSAVPINLESMMMRCYNVPDMYNASTCTELFEVLPTCLDSIRFAQEGPWLPERHVAAQKTCNRLEGGDRHGTVAEDVRWKCYSTEPLGCLPPSFEWLPTFINRAEIKYALGIPDHLNFTVLSDAVTEEFEKYGDMIQPAYLLYTPLLTAGIRLLHYVGAQDANCAWPGVFSFLKLLPSPFQDEFLRTPDVSWPTAEDATVRVVGEGAGNITYILVAQGGHFVMELIDRQSRSVVILRPSVDVFQTVKDPVVNRIPRVSEGPLLRAAYLLQTPLRLPSTPHPIEAPPRMKCVVASSTCSSSWPILITTILDTGVVLLLSAPSIGMYLMLFIFAVYTLARRKTAAKKLMLGYTWVMGICGTAQLLLCLVQTVLVVSFAEVLVQRDSASSKIISTPELLPANFAAVSSSLTTTQGVIFTLNNLVTDSLLVSPLPPRELPLTELQLYRCFVIWGSRWLPVVLPGILVTCTFRCVNAIIAVPSVALLRLPYIFAALTSFVLVALIVHGIAFSVLRAIASHLINIAPTLIIVRVGLGHNIQDTIESPRSAPT